MDLDTAQLDLPAVTRFERKAKQQAARVSRNIIGTAVALAICMWCFIAWSLWSEHNDALAAGRTQGFNLTAAFAGQLSLTFDRVDGALRMIEAQVTTRPKTADPSTAAQGDRDWIASRFPGTNGLFGGFRIIDQDGRLRYSTLDSALARDPGAVDYSAQQHFITHRNDRGAGLIVEKPIMLPGGMLPGGNPPAETPMLQVSRRMETNDGWFAGEVILLIRPTDLINLQNDIDLGRRGGVAVVGTDGLVRAGFDRGHPNGTASLGLETAEPSFSTQLPPGKMSVYIWQSQQDGVDRLVALRRLASFPLVVVVALDLDDVLGQARAHASLIGVVGVGTTALLIVLTTLLVREVRRRTNREIELAVDQDRLQSAHARIEADRRKLGEANTALRVSKENAEAASKAKSQFLAHMSHELRTPLHAIIGFSDLIQEQASPARPGSPPIASYATDISSSGRHLLELINSILDISKVESGTVVLTETVFPLMELARACLTAVRGQANARNVTLEIDMPEYPVRVRADRTRLQQILLNLLSNAVKFTPAKGLITLAVRDNESGGLILSVTDTGIGMTEAETAVAMEPFRQVDNKLSRTFEGTGLGLPLAARLSELHGGRLELQSVKGLGTTATVVLPAERMIPRDVVQAHG